MTSLVVSLAACSDDRHGPKPAFSARSSARPAAPAPGPDPAARAAALVSALGDEDLVGQVLMPFGYGTDAGTVSPAAQAANRRYAGVATPAEMVTRYRLGGLILMSRTSDDPTAATNNTTNIESPAQVRKLTDGLRQAASSLPAAAAPPAVAGSPVVAAIPAHARLLIATDQEYGNVTRVRDGIVQLPAALAFGAARDAGVTERGWRAAGTELAALGINVDFAPDSDVLGDRPGGVIGSRSFGSDPAAVATQVGAAVRGLQGAGVAATLKHFPGHGRTTADSHTDLPVLAQDRAGLEAGDLPPFTGGIQAGAGLVMSGHLDVRAVDPGVPASFSRKVLVDLLRGQLRFDGVVVTDALNMKPAQRGTPGEAAVSALLAGNDLLLMPPDLPAAQRGLLDAVRAGTLPRQRLVEAATRVLTLKYRLGDTAQPAISVAGSAANQREAAAAAAAAITVLRGTCRGALVTGTVRVTASGGRDQQRTWLTEALRGRGVTASDGGGSQVHLVGYGDGAEDLAAGAAVTVAMDTPYLLAGAPGTLVATYSSTKTAMEALADVLAGKATAPGRSPIPVSGLPRSACAS